MGSILPLYIMSACIEDFFSLVTNHCSFKIFQHHIRFLLFVILLPLVQLLEYWFMVEHLRIVLFL